MEGGCAGCLGLHELKTVKLWRGVVAEFIGTLVLVFVGCGACLGGNDWQTGSTTVQISLAFGIIVATMVWCICHISGGHINPAVTAAMCLTRNVSVVNAVFYVGAQMAGAVCGAAILAGVTPKESWNTIGMTTVNPSLSAGQAFGVEFMVTFVLVFTVFASCDKKRRDLNGSTPLSIGLCVTACHLAAIKYTGSSMNPARSFGPAAFMWHYPRNEPCPPSSGITESCVETEIDTWHRHWVYWIGPIVGGIVAGWLYEFIFAANVSKSRARYLLTGRPYDDVTDKEDYDTSVAGGRYKTEGQTSNI